MSVKKKIEKKEPTCDVEAYISKGGNVRADMEEKAQKPNWKTICLRIPNPIFDAIDEKVQERAALTRTAWILEAIQQKLKAEGASHDKEE